MSRPKKDRTREDRTSLKQILKDPIFLLLVFIGAAASTTTGGVFWTIIRIWFDWPIDFGNELHGMYAFLWGIMTLFPIPLFALLARNKYMRSAWKGGLTLTALYAFSGGLGATLSYEFGFRNYVERYNPAYENREIFVVLVWSVTISIFTYLPSLMPYRHFTSVLMALVNFRNLISLIILQVVISLLFVIGSFSTNKSTPELRGFLAASGLRLGLFLGYVVSLLPSMTPRQIQDRDELKGTWSGLKADALLLLPMILYDDHCTREIWQGASSYLSRHVSHPSFASCLQRAEEKYYERKFDDSHKYFTAMAHAIYDRIKEDFSWIYEWEPYDPSKADQAVRLIHHVRAERKGTCLELVLVYLGSLESFHFSPLYLHLRHKSGAACHAIAGYWMIPLEDVLKGRDVLEGPEITKFVGEGKIELVDCTGFADGEHTSPNGVARIIGKLSFEEARSFAHGYLASEDWEVDFALNVRRARMSKREVQSERRANT